MTAERRDLGIMQGRLSPPVDNRIQAFPGAHWWDEFGIAQQLGLTSIEWIVESPLDENPIWTREGADLIQKRTKETGVRVHYICADYFMETPFVRMSADDISRNRRILNHLVEQAAYLHVRGIEIPFVDSSEIRTREEEDEMARALQPCLDLAEKHGISIGLETSLPPGRFAELLKRFNHPVVCANYDIGNSASLGYDPAEEISAYGEWINNVHVKDRKLHGGTVPLGCGNADLPRVFSLFKSIQYEGSYTLQTARGPDEISTVGGYLALVRNWLETQ